ncbi:sigma-70 family RNA polymerase sigma factor [Flavobacterium sp.]|uniref:RNA polymerase sigma factor n=1 Tax=Flavobacterium sp. TaxID=239 RepID=UPI00262CA317|nr:sigma-70 family RNA polymerase sigma factor [Flavobacterium sp.]
MTLSKDGAADCLCEEAVFKSVFELNFKAVRNFLAYRYKNSESADDMAQNAFVILWENCGSIKPVQAKQFLFTTAIRLSLNVIKHNKVVSNFELQSRPKNANSESPEFLLEEAELKKQLEKAISALPEKQREVFIMSRFEDLTYNEIATVLGVSVKAVEKRMHLALQSIRKILAAV